MKLYGVSNNKPTKRWEEVTWRMIDGRVRCPPDLCNTLSFLGNAQKFLDRRKSEKIRHSPKSMRCGFGLFVLEL